MKLRDWLILCGVLVIFGVLFIGRCYWRGDAMADGQVDKAFAIEEGKRIHEEYRERQIARKEGTEPKDVGDRIVLDVWCINMQMENPRIDRCQNGEVVLYVTDTGTVGWRR